jgi:hypothetical protein
MHMHMCMCTCAYDAIPDTRLCPHVTHVQHYIVYMYRVALSHYPLTGTLRHTRSGSVDVGGHGEHEETFGTQWTVRWQTSKYDTLGARRASFRILPWRLPQ